eukprot:scaffold320432_cov29-Prasinocladus_malaysianus.AAC.1
MAGGFSFSSAADGACSGTPAINIAYVNAANEDNTHNNVQPPDEVCLPIKSVMGLHYVHKHKFTEGPGTLMFALA